MQGWFDGAREDRSGVKLGGEVGKVDRVDQPRLSAELSLSVQSRTDDFAVTVERERILM